MKISLSWLSDYLDIAQSPEQIADILTEIGLEVEGMEKKESVPGGLAGIVVGKVIECGKHPNADRLSVTKVDLGGDELVQIVCGAPNVAAGQKVPVATVGTTLYSKEGEPFKIKKGKIRGEVSQGMICAEDELGLGTDHDGIMVLQEDTPVGTPGREYFDLKEDVVFEIGLTPNRSDATCHMGVAKDLAAALKINYEHSGKVKMPDVSEWQQDNNDYPVKVSVENTAGCPRYAGVSISNLTVAESPAWLKERLQAIGVRPINNVVDVTNFVLHELGQPLHAFDLDKVGGQKIIVKTLPQGTKFTTLDEIERDLSEEDLMICDGDNKGMCIGGVFGGLGSGVTEGTQNIFLEAAHFHPRWIRRSSGRHLLYTDASKVFEKGSDPNVCLYGLKRAALLLQEVAGGKISSEIIDIYPEVVESAPIKLRYRNLNRLVGTEIAKDKVVDILQALEAEITEQNAEELSVRFPTNKVDVRREADVIEEVLRIYGFNQVPTSGRMNIGISLAARKDHLAARERVSNNLVAMGYHESMGLSLVRQEYFEEMMPLAEDTLVRINNTSNVQIEIMRPNLLVSALETVAYNQNRQQTGLKLFEFGQAYRKNENDYQETVHLSITQTAAQEESWLAGNGSLKDDTFFRLKATVEQVLDQLGVQNYKEKQLANEHFDFGLSCELGRHVLVRYGRVNAALLKRFGIRNAMYHADFSWNSLLQVSRVDKITTTTISRFPSVRRDLSLVMDEHISFADLAHEIKQVAKKSLVSLDLFDVYRDAELENAGKKSYAISLVFEDAEKTFSDKEIDGRIAQVLKQLDRKFDVRLR